MRVSAAGWLYDTVERTREIARATANVSHDHSEGLKGAECTAAVIFLARIGASKEEIETYVKKEFDYDFSETLEEMRKRHEHIESCMDSLSKALITFLNILSKRISEDAYGPMPFVDVNYVMMQSFDLNKAKAGDTFQPVEDVKLTMDTMTDSEGNLWLPLFINDKARVAF